MATAATTADLGPGAAGDARAPNVDGGNHQAVADRKPKKRNAEDLSFATFCDLLDTLANERRHARKLEVLRDFREKYLTGRRSYAPSVIRRHEERRRLSSGGGGGDGGERGGEGGDGAAAAGASSTGRGRGRRGVNAPGARAAVKLQAGTVSKSKMLRYLGGAAPPPESLVRKPGARAGAAANGAGDGGSGPASAATSVPKEDYGDLFQFYRLLLPAFDDDRGRYHLKEKLLAKALCLAAGRDPRTDMGAQNVIYWNKGSASGRYAGDLALVAQDVLFRNGCGFSFERDLEERRVGLHDEKLYKALTVGGANGLLDKLVRAAAPRTQQQEHPAGGDDRQRLDASAGVLKEMMRKTSPRTMTWLVRIVLATGGISKSRMGHGLSERSALADLHPDGPAYFKVCSSLRRTVRLLSDPLEVPPLDAVQLGCAAMPMKSCVAHDAVAALDAIAVRDQQTGVKVAGDAGVPLSEALRVAASAADVGENDGEGEGGTGEQQQQQQPSPSPSLALATATQRQPPPTPSARRPPQPQRPIAPWFLLETKLDGYRIQVHKDETPGGFGVKFFSPRSGIEHSDRRGYKVLRPLVRRLVRPTRCVLDCELVVYNARAQRVEPFGSNYRCVVFAKKKDLDDPESKMLPSPRTFKEDDGDDFDEGDEEADEVERVEAEVEGMKEAGAERDGGAAGQGQGQQQGEQQQKQRELERKQQRFTTTMSATSAHTLNKRSRGVSLYADEWPAPSCLDAQLTLLAFDILSVDGECVAHKPLSERKRLLRAAVVAESEYLAGDDACDPCDQASVTALLKSNSNEIPRSAANPGREGGLRIGRGARNPARGKAGNEMRGRLLAMVPEEPPLRSLGELSPTCEFGATRRDVEIAAKRAEKNFEEGIMIKALDSQWLNDEHRGGWVKMKPEYAHELDIDAVVLGGRYGGGSRGKFLSELLLGLLEEKPRLPGVGVRALGEEGDEILRQARSKARFVTFCRVGTGLSMDQLAELTRLVEGLPNLAGNTTADDGGSLFRKPRGPPACVVHNGTDSERCDVWLRDPRGHEVGTEGSTFVVTLRADVRAIPSRRYATCVSLRMPRIVGVRNDKAWNQVTNVEEFREQLRESGGMLGMAGRGARDGAAPGRTSAAEAERRRRAAEAAQARASGRRVVAAMRNPHGAFSALTGAATAESFPTTRERAAERPLQKSDVFVAIGAPRSEDEARETRAAYATVQLLGGRLHFLLSPKVTHVVGRAIGGGGRGRGATALDLQSTLAAEAGHAVLSLDWLRDVAAGPAGSEVPLEPRHFLALGKTRSEIDGLRKIGAITTKDANARPEADDARAMRPPDADGYGDPYFRASATPADVKAVLDRFMHDAKLTRGDVLGDGSGGGAGVVASELPDDVVEAAVASGFAEIARVCGEGPAAASSKAGGPLLGKRVFVLPPPTPQREGEGGAASSSTTAAVALALDAFSPPRSPSSRSFPLPSSVSSVLAAAAEGAVALEKLRAGSAALDAARAGARVVGGVDEGDRGRLRRRSLSLAPSPMTLSGATHVVVVPERVGPLAARAGPPSAGGALGEPMEEDGGSDRGAAAATKVLEALWSLGERADAASPSSSSPASLLADLRARLKRGRCVLVTPRWAERAAARAEGGRADDGDDDDARFWPRDVPRDTESPASPWPWASYGVAPVPPTPPPPPPAPAAAATGARRGAAASARSSPAAPARGRKRKAAAASTAAGGGGGTAATAAGAAAPEAEVKAEEGARVRRPAQPPPRAPAPAPPPAAPAAPVGLPAVFQQMFQQVGGASFPASARNAVVDAAAAATAAATQGGGGSVVGSAPPAQAGGGAPVAAANPAIAASAMQLLADMRASAARATERDRAQRRAAAVASSAAASAAAAPSLGGPPVVVVPAPAVAPPPPFPVQETPATFVTVADDRGDDGNGGGGGGGGGNGGGETTGDNPPAPPERQLTLQERLAIARARMAELQREDQMEG